MLWPIEDGRSVSVPSVGRIAVVPPIGHRPALGSPPFFDPIDPQDTDVFAWDWRVIGFPNDPIIAASITVVPPQITVGQIIIIGQVVQVFLGPMTGPTPETLDINAAVTFASGRVLDWDLECAVQAL